MVSKLAKFLKDGNDGDHVATSIKDYEHRYGVAARGDLDERKADYRNFENTYYDLVTDFFEYGWGQSFHFSPRAENESRTNENRTSRHGPCFESPEPCCGRLR